MEPTAVGKVAHLAQRKASSQRIASHHHQTSSSGDNLTVRQPATSGMAGKGMAGKRRINARYTRHGRGLAATRRQPPAPHPNCMQHTPLARRSRPPSSGGKPSSYKGKWGRQQVNMRRSKGISLIHKQLTHRSPPGGLGFRPSHPSCCSQRPHTGEPACQETTTWTGECCVHRRTEDEEFRWSRG